MTRLTLYWTLRERADSNVSIAKAALASEDPVAFLDTARHEPWRRAEDRHRAARWLADALWPAEDVTHPANWIGEHTRNVYELEALERMGKRHPPTAEDGTPMDGYHAGGVHFPDIPRARPLTCPECGNSESFWNFSEVDAGDAVEPELRCPCGWLPEER